MAAFLRVSVSIQKIKTVFSCVCARTHVCMCMDTQACNCLDAPFSGRRNKGFFQAPTAEPAPIMQTLAPSQSPAPITDPSPITDPRPHHIPGSPSQTPSPSQSPPHHRPRPHHRARPHHRPCPALITDPSPITELLPLPSPALQQSWCPPPCMNFLSGFFDSRSPSWVGTYIHISSSNLSLPIISCALHQGLQAV